MRSDTPSSVSSDRAPFTVPYLDIYRFGAFSGGCLDFLFCFDCTKLLRSTLLFYILFIDVVYSLLSLYMSLVYLSYEIKGMEIEITPVRSSYMLRRTEVSSRKFSTNENRAHCKVMYKCLRHKTASEPGMSTIVCVSSIIIAGPLIVSPISSLFRRKIGVSSMRPTPSK